DGSLKLRIRRLLADVVIVSSSRETRTPKSRGAEPVRTTFLGARHPKSRRMEPAPTAFAERGSVAQSPAHGCSSLLESILNCCTVVSPALMLTESPDGAVTKPFPFTNSCQTTTFWAPAGTFLISKFPFSSVTVIYGLSSTIHQAFIQGWISHTT